MQAKRVGMIGYGLEISEYVGYWLTIVDFRIVKNQKY
jgi:hypothetical protein